VALRSLTKSSPRRHSVRFSDRMKGDSMVQSLASNMLAHRCTRFCSQLLVCLPVSYFLLNFLASSFFPSALLRFHVFLPPNASTPPPFFYVKLLLDFSTASLLLAAIANDFRSPSIFPLTPKLPGLVGWIHPPVSLPSSFSSSFSFISVLHHPHQYFH